MKTRKEILVNFHDTVLTQKIGVEINLKELEGKSIVIKPGQEHLKIEKAITDKKLAIITLENALEIIDNMLGGDDK